MFVFDIRQNRCQMESNHKCAQNSIQSDINFIEIPPINEYIISETNNFSTWSNSKSVTGSAPNDSSSQKLSSQGTSDEHINRIGRNCSSKVTKLDSEKEAENNDVFWITQVPCHDCQKKQHHQQTLSDFVNEPVTYKMDSEEIEKNKRKNLRNETMTVGTSQENNHNKKSSTDDDSVTKQNRPRSKSINSKINTKKLSLPIKKDNQQHQVSTVENKCCSVGTYFTFLMAVLLLVAIGLAVLFGIAAKTRKTRKKKAVNSFSGNIVAAAVRWYQAYINWLKRKK